MTSKELLRRVFADSHKRFRPTGSRREKAYQRAMRRYIKLQSEFFWAEAAEQSDRWHRFMAMASIRSEVIG